MKNHCIRFGRICSMIVACLLALSASGQSNYALNLNGTNQDVAIGAPVATGSSYTKEAWIYATSVTGSRNIVSSLNAPFWISGGTLYGGQAGNYSRVSSPSMPTNRWVHVALSYDAGTSTLRLYRDGVLVSTATSVPQYTNEDEFIGSHAGSASYFAGRIDEVKIWNFALSAQQIKSRAYRWPKDNASGLIAYYKCNEGSGATLGNSAGGTNGTLRNGAGWVASPVQYSANALAFDGTNDFVSIPYHSSLNITSAITLEAWVYATKTTGIQNVVAKSSNSINTGYIFPRTDDGWTKAAFYLHLAGTWKRLFAPFPSMNTWHHLAATYDGSMMRMYINGNLVASMVATGSITSSTNALALGNQPGYAEYFGGKADEIRIWNVARSAAQIAANMSKELDPSQETGLVASYSFQHGIPAGNNAGLLTVFDDAGNNNGTMTSFSLSGSSSNLVGQDFSFAILPLRWEQFTARRAGADIQLSWTCSGVGISQGFTVEHSTDGLHWEAIGQQAAANGGASTTYGFTHQRPSAGQHYYRVRQTDPDGRKHYSIVQCVRIEEVKKILHINQPPDGPASYKLSRPARVKLYNSNGLLIWNKTVEVAGEILRGYPPGLYILEADDQRERVFLR